jgi:hypothetical protein
MQRYWFVKQTVRIVTTRLQRVKQIKEAGIDVSLINEHS